MLLTIAYHQIGSGKHATPLRDFEKHLQWVVDRYSSALPGESISKGLKVCLTFDDATFDFYYYVFPLLKKYQLKAVLGVPTGYILSKTTLSTEKRLEQVTDLSPIASPTPSPAFCTWEELKEINDSPLIEIASHSVNHKPMTDLEVDPEYELSASKLILQAQLDFTPQTFIYPYGRFDSAVHARAKMHYPYIMRLGNAINTSWFNTNQLIYRIVGDQKSDLRSLFSIPKYFVYAGNYALNALRGR